MSNTVGLQTTMAETVATTAMPRKRYNHDCVDTGANFTLTADTIYPFPCDCALRDYKVDDKTIWFCDTSTLKDSVDDGVIFIEFNMIVSGPIGTILNFVFYIDHPIDGIIPVKTIPKKLYRNNADEPIHFMTMLYNAVDSDARTYGFTMNIQAEDSTCTLKARSVLAITG